eukprot:gene42914-55776_t
MSTGAAQQPTQGTGSGTVATTGAASIPLVRMVCSGRHTAGVDMGAPAPVQQAHQQPSAATWLRSDDARHTITPPRSGRGMVYAIEPAHVPGLGTWFRHGRFPLPPGSNPNLGHAIFSYCGNRIHRGVINSRRRVQRRGARVFHRKQYHWVHDFPPCPVHPAPPPLPPIMWNGVPLAAAVAAAPQGPLPAGVPPPPHGESHNCSSWGYRSGCHSGYRPGVPFNPCTSWASFQAKTHSLYGKQDTRIKFLTVKKTLVKADDVLFCFFLGRDEEEPVGSIYAATNCPRETKAVDPPEQA